MKKYFALFFLFILSVQLFEGCSSPYQTAREQYGEIFFAKDFIKDENKFIGLGANSFEQGEGLIYIFPKRDGEYYNLKILDANGNIVYSENEYVKPTWVRWVYLSKINLSQGEYTVDIKFSESSQTFNKHFWILGNPTQSGTYIQSSDDFYVSSFTETKGGSFPQKRDSFSKTEVPEVVIIGYKGKLANIKVYSISANKLVNENNTYIPEQSNIYMHIPIQNLVPDSYKVDCSIEGIVVKTLFFTVFN